MGGQQSQSSVESVGGSSLISIPFFLRKCIMWSIGEAERLQGGPASTAEIAAVVHMTYTSYANQGYMSAFIQNMYREDLFFADKEFSRWSLTGDDGTEAKQGYETFSERFRRMYPGYLLNKQMHVVAKPETPTINLKKLVALLKSSDQDLWEANKWIFDGHFRFLDHEPNQSNKISFQSFPRSGNTFLRKYLELLTGIQTGADNTLHISVILQMAGMKGEDIVDDSVWVVKSHSPWIMMEAPIFHYNKMICIVRNPMDTVMSWLNLVSMNCHSRKMPFDVEEVYPEYFDWWVKDCVEKKNAWYRHQMRDAKLRKHPTLFVRFEDLVMDPEPQLRNIMKFMLGVRDLTGTNAERRIKEVIAKGAKATQTYSLKDSTKKLNSNAHRYTPAQLNFIKDQMREMLIFFGYAQHESMPENLTGFYDFSQDTDDEAQSMLNTQFMGYKRMNESMIDWVASLSDEELTHIRIQSSQAEKEVPLMDLNTSVTATRAICNWTQKQMFGRTLEEVK